MEEGLQLDERKMVEYFKRSYRAVDGLWFMKVEERATDLIQL